MCYDIFTITFKGGSRFMTVDDKIIAVAAPKDDDYQSVDIACSAEFSAQGCKDTADEADEK